MKCFLAFIVIGMLAACGGGSGFLSRAACEEPEIKIVHLEGRAASNSVSRCEIRVDPRSAYTKAVFAQEHYEWYFKRETGRSISLAEECMSHEVQVQVVAWGWPDRDIRTYRIREAHLMRGSELYDFGRESWTHKEVVACMEERSEPAREYALANTDAWDEFSDLLKAWRQSKPEVLPELSGGAD